jgi:hypothetical protein
MSVRPKYIRAHTEAPTTALSRGSIVEASGLRVLGRTLINMTKYSRRPTARERHTTPKTLLERLTLTNTTSEKKGKVNSQAIASAPMPNL